MPTHGRAFADPEKGAPGQALSALQARKLREIAAKAREDPPAPDDEGGSAREGTGRRLARSAFLRRRKEPRMSDPHQEEPADAEDGAAATPSATELGAEGHLGPAGDPAEGSDEDA